MCIRPRLKIRKLMHSFGFQARGNVRIKWNVLYLGLSQKGEKEDLKGRKILTPFPLSVLSMKILYIWETFWQFTGKNNASFLSITCINVLTRIQKNTFFLLFLAVQPSSCTYNNHSQKARTKRRRKKERKKTLKKMRLFLMITLVNLEFLERKTRRKGRPWLQRGYPDWPNYSNWLRQVPS